jgi:hypothetical protein
MESHQVMAREAGWSCLVIRPPRIRQEVPVEVDMGMGMGVEVEVEVEVG